MAVELRMMGLNVGCRQMEKRSEGVNQNEAGIGVNDPFLAASVVDCFHPYSLYSSLFPSLKVYPCRLLCRIQCRSLHT